MRISKKSLTHVLPQRRMTYWLYTERVDIRKSFHTLSGVVRNLIGRTPLDGEVYNFINRNPNRNRMKLLHWGLGDRVVYSKML